VIIALGESIVITGATAGSRGLTASSVVALAVAFFVSGALFWLYFGEVAEHSMSDIAEAEDPGSLARVVALAVLGLLGGEMSALVLTGCVAALLAVLAMSEAGWLGRLRTREVVADRTT
jgi:low temperature requirement protein LtrA